MARRLAMNNSDVVPVILAAGPGAREVVVPASERTKKAAGRPRRNAFEIAVANCRGMARPVVVLGSEALELQHYCPSRALVVVNRGWRRGQLSSLLAGLRQVRRTAHFMLYPVDLVGLRPGDIRRLLVAFERRKAGQEIFMPQFQGRPGHPVIFSAATRAELGRAKTARDVVYADPRRLVLVPLRTNAVWKERQ
jgi:CTP:molybdopterin cytidylyltransferase MocA